MNNKLLLAIGVTAIIVFFLLLFALIFRSDTQGPTTAPSPSPTTSTPLPSITPTPLPTELRVISALPEDQNKPYLPIQKITLVFNDTVTPEGVFLETNPRTDIEVLQGESNTLFVVPSTVWREGETDITVLQTSRSTSGKALLSPYTYTIKSEIPEGPDPDIFFP